MWLRHLQDYLKKNLVKLKVGSQILGQMNIVSLMYLELHDLYIFSIWPVDLKNDWVKTVMKAYQNTSREK